MDQRITDALTFANYRLTLQTQRQNIEARVNTALLINSDGAIFKVTQELISYVNLISSLEKPLLVEDNSGNIIPIANPKEFLSKLIDTYHSAMELKQHEQQKLKTARSTAKIVGL